MVESVAIGPIGGMMGFRGRLVACWVVCGIGVGLGCGCIVQIGKERIVNFGHLLQIDREFEQVSCTSDGEVVRSSMLRQGLDWSAIRCGRCWEDRVYGN